MKEFQRILILFVSLIAFVKNLTAPFGIKSIKFFNSSKIDMKIKVFFESGDSKSFMIPTGRKPILIERVIMDNLLPDTKKIKVHILAFDVTFEYVKQRHQPNPSKLADYEYKFDFDEQKKKIKWTRSVNK